jgi:hypothetical protein
MSGSSTNTVALVIRRPLTEGAQGASDSVVSVTDKRRTGAELKEALYAAQRDRGRDPWSDADPVVLINGALVGRLRKDETLDELVLHILERILHSA